MLEKRVPLNICLPLKKPWTKSKISNEANNDLHVFTEDEVDCQICECTLADKIEQIMLKAQTLFEAVVCYKPIVAELVTVFYCWLVITLCYGLHFKNK